MGWNGPVDTARPRDLVAVQSERLRALFAEIVPRNPFWAARLAAAGVRPEQLLTPADLQRLPFVTKSEIVADQATHPPYGTNLTFETGAYSRLHQTSGTTGAPLRWLDTPASWDWMMRCWEQLFRLMRLHREDRLFYAFSFGPFLGFWAGFEGASRLGNLCIPAGGLSSQARLRLLFDHQATILCCTPTYALRLSEVAAEGNIDVGSSPVRAILVAGEPGGNIPATRARLEAAWGARVIDHWGMTEVGPLAIEPEEHPGGLAVLETECIVEIVDPQTGKPVSEGQEGELVITNLGRVGSPLVRYRTGDRVRGERRGGRLFLPGGVLGRTDDMITVRGNNLYPAALEDVVRGFAEVVEFRIEVNAHKAMQHLKIAVEPRRNLTSTRVAELVASLAAAIKDRWHFQAEIVAVMPGSLPRFEMKAQRVIRTQQ